VSEAAHFMDETVEILLLDKCLDRLKDFQGSCCAATRGCSDENGGNRISPLLTQEQLCLFPESLKG